MAGTKRKHEVAELVELSDTEKASQDDDVKQPSSSVNEEHYEAMCYLCHGTGADESGRPLRRDCACRGSDAGFVHLSCLTKYASSKSLRWDGDNVAIFVNPWKTCLSCHQDYQNELAVDIATEFVLFVRRKYPNNTQLQVEALNQKLRALDSMIERLQPMQKIEFDDIANEILSLIDRMKGDVSPLPERYSHLEACAYAGLGNIALEEGTKQSARRAVAHFEDELQVYEAIGDDEGIAMSKSHIAYARSKYEGGKTEEALKASQESYEMFVTKYGEGNEFTIDAGRIYAINLQKADRWGEARELLTKLIATSKQVFGLEHNITKDLEQIDDW